MCVSKEEEVKSLFERVAKEFGKEPYGLVNNAGVLGTRETEIKLLEKEMLDVVFSINVYRIVFVNFLDDARMRNLKGSVSVVNVSSGSAYIGKTLFYSLSKGALDSMLAGLAQTPHKDMIKKCTVENALPSSKVDIN